MTPTDEGRAYATVHGWRRGSKNGMNVGCILAEDNYEMELVQNSSLTYSMIHETQTDTMAVKLGYLTNTGLSYEQKYPTEPDDNTVVVDVEVMMADHHNASNDDIVSVSFAVKFHDVIYVVTKDLKLVRVEADDVINLNTTVNFTEPEAEYYERGSANAQIPITIQMFHNMNESHMEANDAKVRVLLPRPIKFVDGTDTFETNITNANMINNHYIDVNITNLFFTDLLEVNLTVSVDPDNDMIKGLGLIDAAILVRLVCSDYHAQNTIKYCGTSSVLPFKLMGTECFDDLGMASMTDCQFSASTTISADTKPDLAKTGSGGGWSPVARGGPGWAHHITIDFLKKTRVTKIDFESVGGDFKDVTEFKVEYSFNGISFMAPCNTVIPVVSGEAELPSDCRFEARYGRLIIVDSAPDNKAFGVR